MCHVRFLLGLALFAIGPTVVAESPSPLRKPLLDTKPPELISDKDDWIAGPAVTLVKLKGRVVWLQFNF